MPTYQSNPEIMSSMVPTHYPETINTAIKSTFT